MADTVPPDQRSAIMRAVRSQGNRSTEARLAALFRAAGITGWRRNTRVFGRPDFVFPGPRVAVFVDGCFWHGCRAHCRMPASNVRYWQAKIARNRRRDRLVNRTLRARGWTVVRVWEHETSARNATRLARRFSRMGLLGKKS